MKTDAPYLTTRQDEVLKFMAEWQLAHRLAPRLRDIADGLRMAKVTALEHVRKLSSKGLLEEGERYAQRRYRVPTSALKDHAGRNTIQLLSMWKAASDNTRAEFANFVLSWWTNREKEVQQ